MKTSPKQILACGPMYFYLQEIPLYHFVVKLVEYLDNAVTAVSSFNFVFQVDRSFFLPNKLY